MQNNDINNDAFISASTIIVDNEVAETENKNSESCSTLELFY